MAITFRTPDGALHTVAGSDPHLKRESVAVLPTKARNGFRTKGDDADKNRIAALEAEVAVLTAKIETLQADLAKALALQAVTHVTVGMSQPVTPNVTTSVTRPKRTATERQRDSRAARKAAKLANG